MEEIHKILNYKISFSHDIYLSVKTLLVTVIVLIISSYVLRLSQRIITRKLPKEDKQKLAPVFAYVKWLIYIVIILALLHNSGVNLTAVLAASAVVLLGIGLALQTFFQDIISGVFILVDQSVHVGDIIELDGKIGKIEQINLRTTSAVTIDNKVLIIPNHKYLTNSLFNWTNNGVETRERVDIGVAYGSDVRLVERLLLAIALGNENVNKANPPIVRFANFGDSALEFQLIFSVLNSFEAGLIKSEIRFAIDEAFRKNDISIPFPQRDIHIIDNHKKG